MQTFSKPFSNSPNFQIFVDKHGSVIVGIVFKHLNVILLGSDSRMIWEEDGSIAVDKNGVEIRLRKMKSNDSYGLVCCGDVHLFDTVTDDVMKKPYSSSLLTAKLFKQKFINAVHHKPKDKRKNLDSGVLLGTFDKEKDKYIPKLLHVELTVKDSNPSAHHSFYTKHGFDGSYTEELTDYLEENHKPFMSLEQGVELLKNCLKIVKGTCLEYVKWGGKEKDIVGGFISVMEIHLASPQEIEAGKLVDVILREFEEPLDAVDAPTSKKGKAKWGKGGKGGKSGNKRR